MPGNVGLAEEDNAVAVGLEKGAMTFKRKPRKRAGDATRRAAE